MSETLTAPKPITAPPPAAETAMAKTEKTPIGFTRQGVMLTSLAELWRFAELVTQSELAPKGLDTPQKVAVAIQYGAEFGVPPMTSIRGVRVINGVPGWMGDMALGIVRASGKMADFEKRYDGEGESRVCTVTTLRKDAGKPLVTTFSVKDAGKPLVTTFSVKDAKTASLWGKQGPWSQYPDRMLYYRALGFNLRDNFPDVMAGAAIAEELADYPANEVRHVGAGSTQRAALAAAPVVRDALLESIGVTATPDQEPAREDAPPVKETPDPALMKALKDSLGSAPPEPAQVAAAPGCTHPSVPPSRLKPGKTIVCPDCGEELAGEREELTLTAPNPGRRSSR